MTFWGKKGLGVRYLWLVVPACCIVWVVGMAVPRHNVQAAPQPANKTERNNNGAALFTQNCAVCHGADGRGGEHAPDIASRPDIVSLSNAQLTTIITKGIASGGMPAFGYLGSQKVALLLDHLRALRGISNDANAPLPGDPRAGKAIFFARGSCSSCHMMQGQGGGLGNDLSEYGRGRTAAAIKAAILHPDNSNPSWRLTTIHTSDGKVYRGLIRAQDNFTVVLQSEDLSFHPISRRTIRSITNSDRSIMPQDYGAKLSQTQMNDLVSFLMESARVQSPKPE